LLRAAYWVAYDCFNRVHRRLAVARSTLVLFDRHFIDILVDARRYRYGGPAWLLRLIWRLLSKPDLIVLLDAPTEVLQGRKQEVSFEETARQRLAYQRLVREMGNGHIVNADQPFNVVAAGVARIILDHLGTRAERRSSLLPTEGRVA
jgi:thymidylate kinase